MLRRILLFLGLNILIVSCVSILCDLLGVRPFIAKAGLDLTSLATICFIWGMTASLISLFLSKKIAKWSLSLRIIKENEDMSPLEQNLYDIIERISIKANLTKMPEVGIFSSAQCNAFATGASKNSSLIAVSTKLLETLTDEEIEAIVAHEMAHITNGDMVTMTLLQGVINAFVMFFSRICAHAITNFGGKDSRRSSGSFMSYFLFTILFEMIFLSLGSILIFYVSRKREFAADRGSAALVGKGKMIKALEALKESVPLSRKELDKQKGFAAMMIKSTKPTSLSRLFATHPSLDERIEYLESLNDQLWNAGSSSSEFA